jgi:serine/threonine protein kinase
MVESSPANPDQLPLSADRRIDDICDRFEDAWRTGGRPRLEDYLGDAPEPERAARFSEMLRVELHYRRLAGDSPTSEEYRLRFPEYPQLIDALLRATCATAPSKIPPEASPNFAAKQTGESILAAASPTATPLSKDFAFIATLEESPRPSTDWPNIAGYEIVEELPHGGMGIVYKARQLHLNRTVALKMIRTGGAASPQELARFHREAAAVAALDHPYVVRIYDSGDHQGLPYFSMEFAHGGNLSQKLKDVPPSPHEAAQLVETLARTMDYVHQRNIIHRDLKPANVLLTADGVPKIADFGLAKRLDESAGATQTGAIMGTACYMSPEQAEGKTKAIGKAADIYGLGAVLYETLTGRPPFQGATRELTIYQVITDDPVPPSQRVPTVPSAVEAICLKCLQKEPSQRYVSALALAEDLRRFQEGEPISIEPIDELEQQKRWAKGAGYELLEPIGCSALGMVYKARQISLDRLVALWTISAEAETAKMDRFRGEAMVAARLQHPNIIQIYDFGQYKGHTYFSLELADGGSLAERCVGEAMPPHQAVELAETLARATHYAHERGIVHGELRPFNVQLTKTGIPKITGFGLAKLLEKDQELDELKPWQRGVSNYMAPEQVRGPTRAIGPATDVHGLGAMLYEMLTGRPPFLADTVRGTWEQIRAQEPKAPSSLRPEVPESLDEICMNCLNKDPGRRYPSAEILAEELHHFRVRHPPTVTELPPAFQLRIISGPHSGEVHPITRRRIMVGRSADCEVVLRGEPACAGRHFLVNWWTGMSATPSLIDLQSSTGVFVNGQRVLGHQELTSEDVIAVGKTQIVFERVET